LINITTAMEGLRRLATGFGFVGAVGYLGMKVRKAHARVCSYECSTAELLASVSYRHILLMYELESVHELACACAAE